MQVYIGADYAEMKYCKESQEANDKGMIIVMAHGI